MLQSKIKLFNVTWFLKFLNQHPRPDQPKQVKSWLVPRANLFLTIFKLKLRQSSEHKSLLCQEKLGWKNGLVAITNFRICVLALLEQYIMCLDFLSKLQKEENRFPAQNLNF